VRREYFIVPVVLTLGFGVYYAIWESRTAQESAAARQRAKAEVERAKLDALGDSFRGRDGTKEAREDIDHGTPKLKLYGRTRADFDEWQAICRDRFGVQVEALAGCTVTEHLVRYVDAYNAVVKNHVATKFGAQSYEEASKAAWQLYQSRQKPTGAHPP